MSNLCSARYSRKVGGSQLRAEFEDACLQLNLPLAVSPLKRPLLIVLAA